MVDATTIPWRPIGPAGVQPPAPTAKNHANPTKGYPVAESVQGVSRAGQRRTAEPVEEAAPLPVVQSSTNGATSLPPASSAPPSGSGESPPGAQLQPPPATRERHSLRSPDEYPTDDVQDQRFYIQRPDPKRGIAGDYPEGFDLQWVGISVWGQAQPSIESTFLRKGWEPVLCGDFNGRYDGRFLPRSHVGPIILDGQLLVARPMSWSIKAREIAEREAMAPLNIKIRQITSGESDKITLGAQHKSALAFNHVNKSVEGVSLPAPPQET